MSRLTESQLLPYLRTKFSSPVLSVNFLGDYRFMLSCMDERKNDSMGAVTSTVSLASLVSPMEQLWISLKD